MNYITTAIHVIFLPLMKLQTIVRKQMNRKYTLTLNQNYHNILLGLTFTRLLLGFIYIKLQARRNVFYQ